MAKQIYSHHNTGSMLVEQFFVELTESVETLTAIADQYGARTLADLMYLQHVILAGRHIDRYDQDESAVVEVVERLPSAETWKRFIKMAGKLVDPPINKSLSVGDPFRLIGRNVNQ